MIRIPTHIRRTLAMMTFLIVTVFFLMGDFCSDVFSIPIKVDFESDPIDLEIDFSEEVAVDGEDGDYEVDGDAVLPDGDSDYEGDVDVEVSFNEDGYELSTQHLTIDFNDPELGVQGIDKYKGNLIGIFVRSVTYEIVSNNIPGDIPPLLVYLAPETQGNGEDDTYDWDKAIESKEVHGWWLNGDLPEDGIGERGLVKLGQTETQIYGVPILNFPTVEQRLIRQTANIDEISDTILSNFQFEAIVVPTDIVKIEEENRDKIPDDLIGNLQIKLNFRVVVVAKP